MRARRFRNRQRVSLSLPTLIIHSRVRGILGNRYQLIGPVKTPNTSFLRYVIPYELRSGFFLPRLVPHGVFLSENLLIGREQVPPVFTGKGVLGEIAPRLESIRGRGRLYFLHKRLSLRYKYVMRLLDQAKKVNLEPTLF